MIEEASILPGPDGSILILLSPSGMDVSVETQFCIHDGYLRIGQGGQCFVAAELNNLLAADLVIGNPDVCIAEVDETGIEYHSKIREAMT